MGAAFLALGEALIDPISIGLIGNDENPAIRSCRHPGEKGQADQNR